MAVNPYCMPLQKGVTLMAVIDMIFSTIDLIVAILAFLHLTVWTQSELHVSIAMACILFFIPIPGLLLFLRLYFRGDMRTSRIWLTVKMTLFCIQFLSLILGLSMGKSAISSIPSIIMPIIILAIILLYRIYMLYCVHSFIQEMKMDASRLGFQARLEGVVAYPVEQQNSGADGIPNPNYNNAT